MKDSNSGAGWDRTRQDYVTRVSREYKDLYPWIDEAAIQVSQSIQACRVAFWNASTSLTNAFGLGRTAGRASVLRTLSLSPERRLYQKEIAERLLITDAPVTALVDGLEKDDLVERVASETDRRRAMIHLTDKGAEVCERVVPAMALLSSQFCEGFSEQEKSLLVSLLGRFLANAESNPVDAVLASL